MKRKLAIFALAVALGGSIAHPHSSEAAYPGANGQLAYQVRVGGEREIFRANASGLENVNLTNTIGVFDFDPAWSPDGKYVAYAAIGNNNPSVSEIYIVDTNGVGNRLTNLGAYSHSPTWSPDGTRIAFSTTFGGGSTNIYLINVNGEGLTPLTNSGEDRSPAWSPDGATIAFSSTRLGTAQIFVMSSSGGLATQITHEANPVGDPDWSPDGGFLAVASGGAIRTVRADGSEMSPALAPGGIAPAWSPDGSRIAYSVPTVNTSAIWMMDWDGGNQAQVTAFGDAAAPSWQPIDCTVKTVLTGDSFTCNDGRTVRMLQIDAPDPGECGGDWALAAQKFIFLTPGRIVRLNYDLIAHDASGIDYAAPIWRGNDGIDYNLSIVMAYVGLAKAAQVPTVKSGGGGGKGGTTVRKNLRYFDWATASQNWAQTAQWNMWAPGKPFNGGCTI